MRLTIMVIGTTHELTIAARATFPISPSIFSNSRTRMTTEILGVKKRISMSCATAKTQLELLLFPGITKLKKLYELMQISFLVNMKLHYLNREYCKVIYISNYHMTIDSLYRALSGKK